MQENTEFDVVFQFTNDKFSLKSFGTRKNIPPIGAKNSETHNQQP